MELHGIEFKVQNKPSLDEGFLPIAAWNKSYLQEAHDPFAIAITGADDRCVVYRTYIRNKPQSYHADRFYVERLVKTLLWIYGGYKVSLMGSMTLYDYIKDTFSFIGERRFEVEYMEKVYGKTFKVELLAALPTALDTPVFCGRNVDGYRIGFDVSGTERKVTAVDNGKVVYTEEVLWDPTSQSDPAYHYHGVMDALLAARRKLPRLDSICISAPGVFAHNKTKVSPLFRKVNDEDFVEKMEDIYINACKSLGCNKLHVLNNGDVSALSGAITEDIVDVLGVTMGNSMAAGYVNDMGHLTGWLNELACIPADLNPSSKIDGWSGDRGCGINYFSHTKALELAKEAGYPFDPQENQLAHLRKLQIKAELGESKARLVFRTLGIYLGHTLAHYHDFYKFKYVVLLGRMMAGASGEIIFTATQKVLAEEYTDLVSQFVILLPEDDVNRIGSSEAAARLTAD